MQEAAAPASAVVEHGERQRQWQKRRPKLQHCDRSTAMRYPPSRPSSQSGTTSRSSWPCPRLQGSQRSSLAGLQMVRASQHRDEVQHSHENCASLGVLHHLVAAAVASLSSPCVRHADPPCRAPRWSPRNLYVAGQAEQWGAVKAKKAPKPAAAPTSSRPAAAPSVAAPATSSTLPLEAQQVPAGTEGGGSGAAPSSGFPGRGGFAGRGFAGRGRGGACTTFCTLHSASGARS